MLADLEAVEMKLAGGTGIFEHEGVIPGRRGGDFPVTLGVRLGSLLERFADAERKIQRPAQDPQRLAIARFGANLQGQFHFDQVEMELPLEIRAESRYRKAFGILRGPLYFSLRIGESFKQTSKAHPKCDWEITPTTPWNYALVLKDPGPTGEFHFDGFEVGKHPIGSFPFAQKGEPVLVLEADNDKLPLDKK